MKKILYPVVTLISTGIMFLPEPWLKLGFVLLFISFVALIILAHKAALRQHKLGMFAQLTEPGKFFVFQLNENEKRYSIMFLLVALGVVTGLFIRIF